MIEQPFLLCPMVHVKVKCGNEAGALPQRSSETLGLYNLACKIGGTVCRYMCMYMCRYILLCHDHIPIHLHVLSYPYSFQNTIPPGSLRYHYSPVDLFDFKGGFAAVSVSPTTMNIAFYNEDGK